MTALLGIDKGTTTTKAVLFCAETGRVLSVARRATPSFRPQPEWHEEDPEATWQGVAAAVREAIGRSGLGPGDIAGVGVSGHMGGLWALDRDGRAVDRAIAWPDGRAASLLAEWKAEGIVERLFAISGNAPIPGLPIVLLAWMRRHRPEFFERLGHVFCAKDYINYRLTGRIATDESDLSFFPCDIRKRTISRDLFALCGIPGADAFLPEVLATGDLVGRVSAQAAGETGLARGTRVVTGAGDAVAAALGAGALRPGQAVTVIGTSFMNNLTVDRPILEPEGVGFLFLMPGGLWQRLMSNTGGGSLCLDWVMDSFCRTERGGEDADAFFARIEREAAAVPPMSGGLLFHPYLNTSGMTAPRHDPAARGSIAGLSMQTTPFALVRAVMEGVALSMVDCYAALDAPVEDIRITGGGARSRLWCEICAAAMDRPLTVPEAEETGALGAALLAGRACGLYPTLAAGTERLLRIAETVEPDPSLAARYAKAYPLFRRLGEALGPAFAERARLLAATPGDTGATACPNRGRTAG